MVTLKGMDTTLALDDEGVSLSPRAMAQPAKKKAGPCRVRWEHVEGVDFVPGTTWKPAAVRVRVAGVHAPAQADMDSWSMQVVARGAEKKAHEVVEVMRRRAAGAGAIPLPGPRLPAASECLPGGAPSVNSGPRPTPPIVLNVPSPAPGSSRFWRSYMRLLDLQIFVLWLQLVPLLLFTLLVLGVVGVIAWMVLFG